MMPLSMFFLFDPKLRFARASWKASQAERRRDWRAAIRLKRQLLDRFQDEDYMSAEWRLMEIGTLHLKLLDLDTAEAELSRVMLSAEGLELYGAAYGLARVAAERGHFAAARAWIRLYEEAPSSGCGVCIGGRQQKTAMFRAIWAAAALREGATAALQAISSGGASDPALQGPEPAREAQLVLAELLLRRGERVRAERLFRGLASGRDEPADLAWAHLMQLQGRTR